MSGEDWLRNRLILMSVKAMCGDPVDINTEVAEIRNLMRLEVLIEQSEAR